MDWKKIKKGRRQMEEQAKKLQQEYSNLCAVLGDKAFYISKLQEDINDGQIRLSVIMAELEKLKKAKIEKPQVPPSPGATEAIAQVTELSEEAKLEQEVPSAEQSAT